MAVDRQKDLQSTFLNSVRKQNVLLTIFLINGIKLQGVVTWFDNYSVQLTHDGASQLVFKSAISTITSSYPIKLYEDRKDGD